MDLTEKFATESNLVHVLAYGASKTRKTWWAGTAAEAGFSVRFLYCDREGGINILKNIGDEFKKNINVIDIKDKIDRVVAAKFMAKFCSGKPFLWDEDGKDFVFLKDSINPEHHHVWIDPRKLNSNDVLVIDSWKALVGSIIMEFNSENNRDPADAEKIDWDGYGWAGLFGSHFIKTLANLPCHLVMIGHQQIYEKKKTTKETNPRTGKPFTKTVVEWQRTQPQSVSGNHSQVVAQEFDDVLWFYIKGDKPYISTEPASDRDGGSSVIMPGIHQWKDLKFPKVAELANARPHPELQCEAFLDFKPGEEIPLEDLTPKMQFASSKPPASSGGDKPKLTAAKAAKPGGKFSMLAQKTK